MLMMHGNVLSAKLFESVKGWITFFPDVDHIELHCKISANIYFFQWGYSGRFAATIPVANISGLSTPFLLLYSINRRDFKPEYI